MIFYYTTTLNNRTPMVKTTSRALYSPVNMRAYCPPFLTDNTKKRDEPQKILTREKNPNKSMFFISNGSNERLLEMMDRHFVGVVTY